MQLSRKVLNARWALTTAAAVLVFVVLYLLDTALKTKTGLGTTSLQGIGSGFGILMVASHWTNPADAAMAGFLLGLDFLFIPLYAAALFYGSLAALDRFAPKPGRLRRIMTLLALAPIAAGICDAIENGFEIAMLTGVPTNAMASFALEATAGKYLGILIGLVLSLAGLAGRIVKRKG